jgi:sugar/nucleoside kinase (ribokinase family)
MTNVCGAMSPNGSPDLWATIGSHAFIKEAIDLRDLALEMKTEAVILQGCTRI